MLISTDNHAFDSMTTLQYLPGEMLNLIATQIPHEVCVLVTWFHLNRERVPFRASDKDEMKIVGAFTTLELANRAGASYVKNKVEPFIRVEDRGGQHLPPARPTRMQEFDDGTKEWTIFTQTDNHRTTVQTFKHTLREYIWDKKDMPLPLHIYMEHDQKCPCCNTPEEIEAAEIAEVEADEREWLKLQKRRKRAILKELEAIEKMDLDSVVLSEEEEEGEDDNETEDEDTDHSV